MSGFDWTDDDEKEEQSVFPTETSYGTIVAELPWGTSYTVLSTTEKEDLERTAREYTEQNHFTNVSDFSDLERLVTLELLVKRYNQWQLQEVDYHGEPVDPKTYNTIVRDYAKEVREIKKTLRLDRVSRDKAKGENTADFVYTLGLRAKEFVVMRNAQFTKAITLWKELEGLVNFHDNADDEERKEFRKSAEDILEHIRKRIPEFNQIDEDYRKNNQQYWIRSMR